MSPPPTPQTALTPGRIAGLDAWRALLMSAGLFVHGSLWLPPTPLFRVIGDASQAFRMGAFFAISGFLTSLALRRREPAQWLQHRLIQLGVPAMCGLFMLSPLIWYIVVTSRTAAYGWPLMPFEWHHFWFLFGLMLYSILGVALHEIDCRVDAIRRMDNLTCASSGRISILMIAAAGAGLLASAAPVLRVALPINYVHSFGNAQLIAGYLPMFVLGFILARAPQLRRNVVEERDCGIAICLGMIAAYAAAHLLAPLAPLADYVRFVAAALCPPAAFVLILRSALAIRRVPRLVQHFSDASYTIYILHYPVSILINTRFAIGVEPHIAYILSVLASGAASFAFHVLAVQRSPALTLFLNGRLPAGTQEPQAREPVPDFAVSEDTPIVVLADGNKPEAVITA